MATSVEVQELNNRSNALITLLDRLLLTARPQLIQRIVYAGAKFYLQLLVEQLAQIARQVATEEIKQVVGNDFDGDMLSDNALYDRVALLPTITDLRDNYGINLIGTTSESLAVWLSNAAADLALITTIYQAVLATAQSLWGQIDSWDDPNTGYLRGISNISTYLNGLQNASSAAAAFHLVAYHTAPLSVTLSSSSYPADSAKLFGYLRGWEYAKFARRVIQIDHDIYEATYGASVASRLWDSQNWLPAANALLRTDWTGVPGFAIAISPVSILYRVFRQTALMI